ncbi:chemotaxis protein CheX [Aneurinibacillus terranovensis]|uniref:chemotaxis protein CheX n=1 Tax=Aneurinibacillus terranovensis TaxID=278991 RepID=UPI0009D6B8D3|nr:chemotaxis protein CheX [Aneurinibacillus terranovensis]
MKLMYINPFLESTSYIFGQFQLSCQVGNPILQETPFSGKEILTVVGVTGEIRGQIDLGIPMASALKIVSKMMGGVDVPSFDSMAQSAICELSNMICGNAITRFSKEGILLDITPPTLILGNKMEVAAVKMRVLSIPVLIEGMESLEMNIVLEEKK